MYTVNTPIRPTRPYFVWTWKGFHLIKTKYKTCEKVTHPEMWNYSAAPGNPINGVDFSADATVSADSIAKDSPHCSVSDETTAEMEICEHLTGLKVGATINMLQPLIHRYLSVWLSGWLFFGINAGACLSLFSSEFSSWPVSLVG